MKKKLIILIGPKGAGKTSIGLMCEKKAGIKFLRVESIWLNLSPGEEGWEKVEAEVDKLLLENDKVVIESLGAGEGFERMYASLRQKHDVKLVRVWADLPICFARVKNRDNSQHIAVSDEQVEEYNQIAARVSYNWDAVIDNNELVKDDEVVKIISAL